MYFLFYVCVFLFVTQNIRGVTSALIIAEEGAFIEAAVFEVVMVPLIRKRDCALLAITTLDKAPLPYFDKIINKQRPTWPAGTTLFKQCNVSLICPSCKAKGHAGSACLHIRGLVPDWLDGDREPYAEAMISNVADMLRETKNIKSLDTPNCFKEHLVERLFCEPRVRMKFPDLVQYIYVAIDPNSGTKSSAAKTTSDYALVTAIEARKEFGTLVFVSGLESIDSHGVEDFLPPIMDHLKQLRRAYPLAVMVDMSENNTGHEASWLQREIRNSDILNVCFMDEHDLATGVGTTHAVKQTMMAFTREAITQKTIGFLDQIVTHYPGGEKAIMDVLKEQLCMYQEVREDPTSLISKTKVGWTGKLQPGIKDDLCVALQLLIYWRTVFLSNTVKYARYYR